jgi:PiT family inorganic phosphate transporter
VDLVLVILVIVVALGFDFTNGFHDAANAIATAVSTRALRPRTALIMAAVMNMVGALLGTAVAETIAKEIVNLEHIQAPREELIVVLAGLLGAVTWNLITWWLGLPSSSSHALIGGLAGAGLAAHIANPDVQVLWGGIVHKVVIPMVVSPAIGFTLAFFAMIAVLWIFRNSAPHRTFRRFRFAQMFSSAAVALGHGLQDAQKTMGVIFMATVAVDWYDRGTDSIPLWIKLCAATAISLGTYSGGWRIMRTLGRKVIEVDPARGFVAESVSALVLYVMAIGWHAPISTTHSITSSIMGVGATRSLSAVRWGMAGNIVAAWLLTIPAAALVAAVCHVGLSALVGLF